MKIAIIQACEYRSKKYKKNAIVEVEPDVGAVLLRFKYGKEVEESVKPKSEIQPVEEKTPEEEPSKEEPKPSNKSKSKSKASS